MTQGSPVTYHQGLERKQPLKRTKQMQRGKPLKAKPRAKGNRGELAVRDLFHRLGWTAARRNFQSGGQGGGDIIEGPADHHIEVKWCERWSLKEWLRQARDGGRSSAGARPSDTVAVVFRSNDTDWLVCVDAEAYFRLVAEVEGMTGEDAA